MPPSSNVRPVAIQRAWFNAEGDAETFAYVFDATISEDVTLSSVVTKHPIDTGVSVSDHMYDEPDKLIIHAVVSDILPWDALENQQRGAAVSDFFSQDSVSRSAKALATLDALRKRHEPFNVQTGLRLFKNMVVESIRYTTDKDTGNVLAFTAQLSEVIVTSTQSIAYTAPKDKKTKRQVAKPKDKGEVKTEEPTEVKAEEMMSLLFKLVGSLGN